MISLRARIIRFTSKQLFKKISPDADVTFLRQSFEMIEGKRKPASSVQVTQSTIAGRDCRWLVPKGCESAPVLYYLHGGAYVVGSPATHTRLVSHIAKRAHMRALLPDYSLAPEKPFPAGLHDCVAVYRGLLESGVSPSDVAIAGDSAGGGMSVATLLYLRDAGDRLPATAVLLSPWLDLTGQGESMQSRAKKDPWFRPDDMKVVARKYRPDGVLDDPLVSPVYANVENFPPLFVQVGDHEILLSDSTRLADKIKSSGGDIELQIWPHMWHVFQFFIGQMPESKKAVRAIAAYLRANMLPNSGN